jgi:hypothetical protein
MRQRWTTTAFLPHSLLYSCTFSSHDTYLLQCTALHCTAQISHNVTRAHSYRIFLHVNTQVGLNGVSSSSSADLEVTSLTCPLHQRAKMGCLVGEPVYSRIVCITFVYNSAIRRMNTCCQLPSHHLSNCHPIQSKSNYYGRQTT